MTKQFKKSNSVNGKLKGICVHEGIFMDAESGEQVDVADLIARAVGEDTEVDISVSVKTDEDIDV